MSYPPRAGRPSSCSPAIAKARWRRSAGATRRSAWPRSTCSPDDLDARPLTDVGQAVVLPEAHPLAKTRRVGLADLGGARLVVPGPDRPHRVVLARALLEAGVAWEVAVEAKGWELMRRFVELGVGWAVVNACCRIPAGLVAKPLGELPRQRYHVLRRLGAGARTRRRPRIAPVLAGAYWKKGWPCLHTGLGLFGSSPR